ncbi:MAG: type II toxin-antitoxin system VapC family toxin [Chloroflexi bacterium]|nr:type II toxin-antitoxin system VapC family toxin [Chloroflexota bacterium]
MFLLDTNTLIYFFKGMGNVSAKLVQTLPKEIHVPSIVVYELEVGIAKSTSPQKRIQQLNAFLSNVDVLPFGRLEANKASEIRVELEEQGQPIGSYDILIAATALANNATLVTHNTKEFGRIKRLSIEDWF